MKLPIYRAKKIDSDENICGYLIELEEMFYISSPKNIEPDTAEESRSVYYDDNGLCIDKNYFVAIDQTTLEISFNNGKSFIKLNDLEIHTCTNFELKY